MMAGNAGNYYFANVELAEILDSQRQPTQHIFFKSEQDCFSAVGHPWVRIQYTGRRVLLWTGYISLVDRLQEFSRGQGAHATQNPKLSFPGAPLLDWSWIQIRHTRSLP